MIVLLVDLLHFGPLGSTCPREFRDSEQPPGQPTSDLHKPTAGQPYTEAWSSMISVMMGVGASLAVPYVFSYITLIIKPLWKVQLSRYFKKYPLL